jgi:glycosyltransferase involved in cell wall biosynthesis
MLNAVGRPVYESAFYSKTSIVAIDRSWPDMIIDGKTGLIVKENDPHSIANAIEGLYKNQELLKKMGRHANRLALNNI